MLYPICYILFALFGLDLLARLSLRQSRELGYFSPRGTLAVMIAVMTDKPKEIAQKRTKISRFIAATLVFFIQLGLILTLFSPPAEQNLERKLLALSPILALPFYHLFFGLMSNQTFALSAATTAFKKRALISLIIAANIMFITLLDGQEPMVIFSHLSICGVCLIYLFYLTSTMRLKPSPRFLCQIEDSDDGAQGLYHYMVSLLEFSYITLLLSHILFKFIESYYLINQNWFPLIFIIILSLIVSIIARIWIYQRSPWSEEILEEFLLPMSFLLFGANYLLANYF